MVSLNDRIATLSPRRLRVGKQSRHKADLGFLQNKTQNRGIATAVDGVQTVFGRNRAFDSLYRGPSVLQGFKLVVRMRLQTRLKRRLDDSVNCWICRNWRSREPVQPL